MADILINTGTGPVVATELIGTAYHQKMRLTVGASGTDKSLVLGQTVAASSIPVVIATDQSTLNVAIVSFTPTITATVSNTVTITGTVTGLPSGTQDVSIIGTPTITVGNNITITGTSVVSVVNTPVVTATISNNPLVVTAANITVASITTGSVSVINTPVITATISNNPLIVTASGVTIASVTTIVGMPVLSASNVTIASVTTGTVSALMSPVYGNTETGIGATGTGVLFIGVQSGATTSRAIVVTTTGAQHAFVANTPTVTLSTALALTVGLITTGTITLSNTAGLTLAATTASVGAFVKTAHASRWQAYAVNVTSGASAIIKTSGAHTLYITSLFLNYTTVGVVTLMSAATTLLTVAFSGNQQVNLMFDPVAPLTCTTAQSLTFTLSVSNSCRAFACGYTVT